MTGGAGFIGSHTVDALLAAGWQVVVLDNFSTGSRSLSKRCLDREDCSFIEGGVEDGGGLNAAAEEADVVFHLAAMVSVPLSVEQPEECFRINVAAFERLLMTLRRRKTPLLYASSAAVYGDRDKGARREEEAPKPLSPYGASKAINEIQALAAWHTWGVPSAGFRFFNVYGERQNTGGAYASVIPRFCEKLLRGEAPVIYGDGGQTRDFIYVKDAARALLDFIPLVREGRGAVFNVASGKKLSVLEVLGRLRKLGGLKTREVYLPERPDDIRDSFADVSKITSALKGWAPTDIDDGLKKTLEWYRKNPG